MTFDGGLISFDHFETTQAKHYWRSYVHVKAPTEPQIEASESILNLSWNSKSNCCFSSAVTAVGTESGKLKGDDPHICSRAAPTSREGFTGHSAGARTGAGK